MRHAATMPNNKHVHEIDVLQQRDVDEQPASSSDNDDDDDDDDVYLLARVAKKDDHVEVALRASIDMASSLVFEQELDVEKGGKPTMGEREVLRLLHNAVDASNGKVGLGGLRKRAKGSIKRIDRELKLRLERYETEQLRLEQIRLAEEQLDLEKEAEKLWSGDPDKPIICVFLRDNGWCRFGSGCKFSHRNIHGVSSWAPKVKSSDATPKAKFHSVNQKVPSNKSNNVNPWASSPKANSNSVNQCASYPIKLHLQGGENNTQDDDLTQMTDGVGDLDLDGISPEFLKEQERLIREAEARLAEGRRLGEAIEMQQRLNEERAKEEAAKRLEQERAKEEAAKRLEQERAKEEAAKRLEQERAKQEAAKRLEQERAQPITTYTQQPAQPPPNDNQNQVVTDEQRALANQIRHQVRLLAQAIGLPEAEQHILYALRQTIGEERLFALNTAFLPALLPKQKYTTFDGYLVRLKIPHRHRVQVIQHLENMRQNSGY